MALKAIHAFDVYEEYLQTADDDLAQVYRKSEADFCILKQKRKRCLAMAMRCWAKSDFYFVLAWHGKDVSKNNRKAILYSKWYKRWLELADKFKEDV